MALSFLGPVKTIDDAAGVAYGRIVIEGATSVKKPTSDNEAAAVGVTMEEQLTQDGQVEVAQSGVAAVEIQESVALGEYCVVGDDGYGRPESAFKSGAELNVVGVFMESVTYGSGVAFARVAIGIGKRIRRVSETLTATASANSEGITYVDAGGNSTITIGDGVYDGQIKTVVRTDSASHIVSASVTNHVDGTPEAFALNEGTLLKLVWDSDRGAWITLHYISTALSFQYTTENMSQHNTGSAFGFSPNDDMPYHRTGGVGSGALQIIAANDITPIGNVGSGQDDLMDHTLLSGVLDADGVTVKATFFLTFANNANAKTVKAFLHTTQLFTTGALLLQNSSAILTVYVTRTGSSAQNFMCVWNSEDALLPIKTTFSTATIDMSSSRVLKLTGEATSDDDIICKQMIVEFIHNPPAF